jgi:voltage-gated potassium channel
MPIYRTSNPNAGQRHLRAWYRGILNMLALLFAAVAACAVGLMLLDTTSTPFLAKFEGAIWNAMNLVTTLGDFGQFDPRQKLFMMGTMLAFLVIGGYAVSRLTGILSSESVMLLRENKMTAKDLDRLSQHVIVIGFQAIGQLVASKLRAAGETVVVVDRSDESAGQASEAGYLVVLGDAGIDDTVFDRAGLDRARALMVTTQDPDRNVAITLMAHSRNPALLIAVTGDNHQRGQLLHRAGAKQVVILDDIVSTALVSHLAAEAKA